MNKENKKMNFIICPECHGTGLNAGNKCLKCKGVGVALYLQDKVIYYGANFNSAHILFDKIVRRIEIAFNVVLGLIGLAGVLSLIYYGYQYGALYFLSIEYWLTPSPLKLFFWFSLLVDLYLYYRLDQESSQKNKVLPKQYKSSLSSNEVLDFDTIWQLKKSKLIDVSKSYTEESKKSIQAAYEITKHFGHDKTLRVHLFAILTQFDASAIILARLGVNFDEFKKKVSNYITKNIINRGGDPVLSLNIHKILLLAYLEAHENNDKKVDLIDIILALANPQQMDLRSETDDVEELLVEFDLTYQKLKNVVQWLRIQKRLKENMSQFKAKARYKPKSGLDRAMTAIATPILDQFSEDLTLQAKYGHLFPCIGRETEIETIFRIFEGSRDGGLLIGNQGVGRTAILHGVAERMVEENVPESLQDKRLVVLDIAKLLAGVDASGAEQRLLMLASEIIRSGNIVLAVENLHNLSGITAGNQSSLDLSEVFAQILGRHQFYCLATTTPSEYLKAVEGRNLGSVFQRIDVKELEINDAILVLEAKSGPIEYQNQVYFSYNAIENAVTLSSKYIHDRMLPEKGLAIIEQAAIMVKKEKGENKVVTGEDVATIVSNISNVPVNKLSEKESEKLLHLEDRIHERMVDQEEAVNIVAASLRRARANLREGKRPIASLLFLGPTGVGKTELAKTVADIYFGNEKSMIRIDMSEYQEKNSISRLIGQGETPGQLTETVRKNPFSLVLFDEVEKAHPDVLNLFLQMMDDGRLTDSLGRTIDFTNAIIIMTSNAGAQFIQDEIKKGSSIQTIKESLIDNELKETYRPEFINRLDGVVVFKPLSMTDVIKIARILIDKVIKNLEEKGITFEVTDSAVSELAEQGFDPKYGARPLRRVIQNKIDDELAKLLLEDKIKRRDKVVLDTGGEIKIVKADEL